MVGFNLLIIPSFTVPGDKNRGFFHFKDFIFSDKHLIMKMIMIICKATIIEPYSFVEVINEVKQGLWICCLPSWDGNFLNLFCWCFWTQDLLLLLLTSLIDKAYRQITESPMLSKLTALLKVDQSSNNSVKCRASDKSCWLMRLAPETGMGFSLPWLGL